MDHIEKTFRNWAEQDGLALVDIIADFDETGEPLRLWWFFSDDHLISPREGLCDEEVIMFFGAQHELTYADRLLFDQYHASNNWGGTPIIRH